MRLKKALSLSSLLYLISTPCVASGLTVLSSGNSELTGQWLRDQQIAVPAASDQDFQKSQWRDFRRGELTLITKQQAGQYFAQAIAGLHGRQWQSDRRYVDWQLQGGISQSSNTTTLVSGAITWHSQDNVGALDIRLQGQRQSGLWQGHSYSDYQLFSPWGINGYFSGGVEVTANPAAALDSKTMVRLEAGVAFDQGRLTWQRDETVQYQGYDIATRWYGEFAHQGYFINGAWGADKQLTVTKQFYGQGDWLWFTTIGWQNDEFRWRHEALHLALGMRLLSH